MNTRYFIHYFIWFRSHITTNMKPDLSAQATNSPLISSKLLMDRSKHCEADKPDTWSSLQALNNKYKGRPKDSTIVIFPNTSRYLNIINVTRTQLPSHEPMIKRQKGLDLYQLGEIRVQILKYNISPLKENFLLYKME